MCMGVCVCMGVCGCQCGCVGVFFGGASIKSQGMYGFLEQM